MVANKQQCHIALLGWVKKNGSPYIEVLLCYQDDWIPLCETEEGDFENEKQIDEAARWMVYETINYATALNTCNELPIKIDRRQPWKNYRRRK